MRTIRPFWKQYPAPCSLNRSFNSCNASSATAEALNLLKIHRFSGVLIDDAKAEFNDVEGSFDVLLVKKEVHEFLQVHSFPAQGIYYRPIGVSNPAVRIHRRSVFLWVSERAQHDMHHLYIGTSLSLPPLRFARDPRDSAGLGFPINQFHSSIHGWAGTRDEVLLVRLVRHPFEGGSSPMPRLHQPDLMASGSRSVAASVSRAVSSSAC